MPSAAISDSASRLVAMGFDENRVTELLKAANFDEALAADLLLADSDSTPHNTRLHHTSAAAAGNAAGDAAGGDAVGAAAAVGGSAQQQQKQQQQQQQQQISNHPQRSWGASVSTLRSMGPQYQYETNGAPHKAIPTQNIPALSQADETRAVLDRIRTEFEPIIRRRGFNVLSITEMCCCSDGLDHLPSFTNKQRRKTKRMPDNVLGYNLSTGYRKSTGTAAAAAAAAAASSPSSTHRIHLRLRHPPSAGSWQHHILFPFEHIAGTMCHELAHCIHGNHDALFYKLMDEIIQEYELLLVRGLGSSTSFSSSNKKKSENPWSSQGYTLGGTMKDYSGKTVYPNKRNVLAQAALGRFNTNHNTNAQPVGKTESNYEPLHTFLTPREAAAIAAESRWMERQRIDSQFCLPCREIIEILDEEEDDEDEEEKKKRKGRVDGAKCMYNTNTTTTQDIIEILDD